MRKVRCERRSLVRKQRHSRRDDRQQNHHHALCRRLGELLREVAWPLRDDRQRVRIRRLAHVANNVRDDAKEVGDEGKHDERPVRLVVAPPVLRQPRRHAAVQEKVRHRDENAQAGAARQGTRTRQRQIRMLAALSES